MKELNTTVTSVIIKHKQNILYVYTIKPDMKELITSVISVIIKHHGKQIWLVTNDKT